MATQTLIWIIRKGNGQLRVHPSTAVIPKSGTFNILNTTADPAQVDFPTDTVVDASGGSPRIPVAARSYSPDLVVHASCGRKQYFEYDVMARGDYGEGGSKPGGIIDP